MYLYVNVYLFIYIFLYLYIYMYVYVLLWYIHICIIFNFFTVLLMCVENFLMRYFLFFFILINSSIF